MAPFMQGSGTNKRTKSKGWESALMSMVPFTKDFSWMERLMDKEDISPIINARYMLVNGSTIENKDMVN